MLVSFKHSATGVIIRFKIRNTAAGDGSGKTGLAHDSSGLIISTIADNEPSATVYTAAASNLETIATLGTYAAPSADKARFKEVDATNHPGIYELHLANARFAVASAKFLIVSVHGAADAEEVDFLIPLPDLDPYAAKADINAQVLDVLNVDTFAQPGQEAPAATTTLVKMLSYLYKALRNKVTQTENTFSLFADDGTTVDQKATTSDDGTTFTRGELGTGP